MCTVYTVYVILADMVSDEENSKIASWKEKVYNDS